VSTPERPTALDSLSRRRALGFLAFAPLAAGCTALLRGDELTDNDIVYSQLMCNCGCNQVLGECNHIGCPNSVPMRAEVDRYLAEGHTPDETVAMFVEKYGPNIRSAPPGNGWFNVSAWVTPFAALGLGTVGVAYYLGRMLRRGKRDSPPPPPAPGTGTLERLENELADFTPED